MDLTSDEERNPSTNFLNFKESDFDTLIILDACRYDFYTELRNAEKAISPGSDTRTSIPKMFPYKYPNTIYISGNPVVNSGACELLKENVRPRFKKVVNTWNHGWTRIQANGKKIDCVPPGEVVKDVRRHRGRNKIVAHFIQPHRPYIGETKLTGGPFTRYSIDTVRSAYMDNLRLVLNHALKCVRGKTIITSDHGELFTERGGSHPPNKDAPELREVPYELLKLKP